MLAFATFAAGFVARPIGGLVFGHFGDRIGRKKMLILTLLIMGGSTTVIGLLPTYDTIGVWAPLLLVTMRVLQGIGVGGEYGGAVLMAVEYAPHGRRAFFGSFAHVGVPAGLLLASGAFGVASLLPPEAFLAWGWRATFVSSLVLLAIGAYIRLNVLETPAFDAARRDRQVLRVPALQVWQRHRRTMLLAMGTRWVEGFTFNVYSVYLLSYAATDLGLSTSAVLGGVGLGAAVGGAGRGCAGRSVRPAAGLPRRRVGLGSPVVPCLLAGADRGVGVGMARAGRRSRPAVRHHLRAAGRLLGRAVRHAGPLHRHRHHLPGVGDRRQRTHAVDRRLAGGP
jgi:MFS family permease